jgi:hypothetical protein
VVTVQSCIAKGPFSAAEFNIRFAQFAAASTHAVRAS